MLFIICIVIIKTAFFVKTNVHVTSEIDIYITHQIIFYYYYIANSGLSQAKVFKLCFIGTQLCVLFQIIFKGYNKYFLIQEDCGK